MTPITFCCVTFNAERTLDATLSSLAGLADEIVIIDSFSTDATLEIARRYTSHVHQDPYLYHGVQMNKSIDRASNDWVFCVDADESLDDRLIQAVREWKERGPGDHDAFRVHREWLFLGRSLHAFYPVSSPDRIVRLFGLLKSKHVSLPNILLKQSVVPELLQDDCSVEKITDALLALFRDEARMEAMQTQLSTLLPLLAGGGAEAAADAVSDLLPAR